MTVFLCFLVTVAASARRVTVMLGGWQGLWRATRRCLVSLWGQLLVSADLVLIAAVESVGKNLLEQPIKTIILITLACLALIRSESFIYRKFSQCSEMGRNRVFGPWDSEGFRPFKLSLCRVPLLRNSLGLRHSLGHAVIGQQHRRHSRSWRWPRSNQKLGMYQGEGCTYVQWSLASNSGKRLQLGLRRVPSVSFRWWL